jgi:hypothetical protein
VHKVRASVRSILLILRLRRFLLNCSLLAEVKTVETERSFLVGLLISHLVKEFAAIYGIWRFISVSPHWTLF